MGKKGFSPGVEIKLRSDIAWDEAERHRTQAPGADMLRPDVKAFPDCGPEAAARISSQDAIRRYYATKDNNSSSSSAEQNDGWIMTVGLKGIDLGDPFDHAIRFIKQSQSFNEPHRINFNQAFRSVASFFNKNMSYDDVVGLYGIYNSIGLLLGIDHVRGENVSTMGTLPNSITRMVSRSNLKEKGHGFFETIGWHLKMGAEEAFDIVTQRYGAYLLNGYLQDLKQLIQDPENISQEHLENSVKRVNAAYASIRRLQVNQSTSFNFTQAIESARKYIIEHSLDEICQDVAVTGPDESFIILGQFDKDLEDYGEDFTPKHSLGKAGGWLRNRTREVYRVGLSAYLDERFGLVRPAEFIPIADEAVPLAKLHQMRFVRQGGQLFPQSLVFTALTGPYEGKVFKHSLPILTSRPDGKTNINYLPPGEEKRLMEIVAQPLRINGFNIVTPQETQRNILIEDFAPGDYSLFDLYKALNKKQLNGKSELAEEAIAYMTNQATWLIADSLMRLLEQEGIHAEFDRTNRIITFTDENGRKALYYLDTGIDHESKEADEKYLSLTNWRIDIGAFLDKLTSMRIDEAMDKEDVIKQLSILLQSYSTLFDPFGKEVEYDVKPDISSLYNNPVRATYIPRKAVIHEGSGF